MNVGVGEVLNRSLSARLPTSGFGAIAQSAGPGALYRRVGERPTLAGSMPPRSVRRFLVREIELDVVTELGDQD